MSGLIIQTWQVTCTHCCKTFTDRGMELELSFKRKWLRCQHCREQTEFIRDVTAKPAEANP